jgi:hypothetical protein
MVAPRGDAWLAAARANFAAARAAEDRVLVDVMPVEVRIDGELLPGERAQRRCAVQMLWKNAFLLSQMGAVVVGIAWLMLHWHVSTFLSAMALVPIAWLGRRWSQMRAQPFAAWLEQALVEPAVVVSAHESLRRAGPELAAPAAFLVSFDAALAADLARLQAAAKACADLRLRESLAGDEARVRDWLLAFERRADFGRVPVPPSLCGAGDTFLVGVGVKRWQLPAGRLDQQVYPLLLRQGPDESAELLPPELWADAVEEVRSAPGE